MAKKGKRKHQHEDDDESGATLTRDPEAEGHAEEDGHKHTAGLNGRGAQREKMSNKEYEKALKPLQIELVKLQNWAKQTGARAIVVFEGRDAAGKGGCIKAITERVSPRVFRIVALPAPTEREKTQMYLQRYMEHFPAAGEIMLFDRSWYNRAGVEHVLGYCTDEQYRGFLRVVPETERVVVQSGIMLIKYWLEVGQDEQTAPLRGAHSRRAQDVEAQPAGSGVAPPLVRLLARARRDVRRDRHAGGALVRDRRR